MTSTIEYNNYGVTLVLNSQTIFIKIIDSATYKSYESHLENIKLSCVVSDTYYLCYESEFDMDDITLTLELFEIYQILENSFKRCDGYNVNIDIQNGRMTLLFTQSITIVVYITVEIVMNENNMYPGAVTHTPMERIYVANPINDTEILNRMNETYLYNEDPICVFDCFGYLPITQTTYQDKHKLE